MIKTNIKQALRYVLSQKKYSFVIVMGLSVGMAASFLLYSYVYFESSFDNFHESGNNIYRVIVSSQIEGQDAYKSPYSYAPQGSVAMDEIPEVDSYVRLMAWPEIVISTVVNNSEKTLSEHDYYYTDDTFFNIFTFPLILGNPATVLKDPGTAVISESMANKLFGKQNPINKELKINGQYSMRVTGVFEDIPENTHLKFNMLLSLNTFPWIMNDGNAWNNHSFFTYLKLKDGANPGEVQDQLTAAYLKENRAIHQSECSWELQPVDEAYLNTSDFTSKPEAFNFGDERIVYFLSLIAFLILCIAWINYINLTTAKATERYKEIGIRKTNGAGKIQLIFQFFSESLLYNILSIILAGAIVSIAYTWFTKVMGFSFSIQQNKGIWIMVVIILTIAILLPGLLASLFLSSHNPIKIQFNENNRGLGFSFRNGLVIFQFIIIIALMTGVIVVNQQLEFLHSVDLGFQKEQIVVLNAPRIEFSNDKFKMFSEELKKHSGITDVTASVSIPGERFGSGNGGPSINGAENHDTYFRVGRVMSNYLSFCGIKLVAGRSFDENQQANTGSIIINEEGVDEFGLQYPEEAVSRKVDWNGGEFTIIGVTQSFHQQSLHITPEPMILFTIDAQNSYNYLLVKLDAARLNESIATIQDNYKSIFPGNPFNYFFLDNFFDQQYKKDIAFRKLFSFFSLIALIIGFIGLYGLTTFRILKRTKEIGVRKVNGAKVSEVIAILNKDFVYWVAVAFIFATPLAWFAMHQWLENFAYKTDLSWWIFALAGVLALGIALLTVSWQSWRAATRNPVEALRYE